MAFRTGPDPFEPAFQFFPGAPGYFIVLFPAAAELIPYEPVDPAKFGGKSGNKHNGNDRQHETDQ
jgi:hypothetical protein